MPRGQPEQRKHIHRTVCTCTAVWTPQSQSGVPVSMQNSRTGQARRCMRCIKLRRLVLRILRQNARTIARSAHRWQSLSLSASQAQT